MVKKNILWAIEHGSRVYEPRNIDMFQWEHSVSVTSPDRQRRFKNKRIGEQLLIFFRNSSLGSQHIALLCSTFTLPTLHGWMQRKWLDVQGALRKMKFGKCSKQFGRTRLLESMVLLTKCIRGYRTSALLPTVYNNWKKQGTIP